MGVVPIPDEQTAACEQALADGDLDTLLRAADALQQQGHSRRSETWLRKAWEAHPADARCALRLLEMYLRYRSFEAFDVLAADAAARHPASADLHYTIGRGAEGRRAWAEAARAFGRAADLAPEEVEARVRQVRGLRILGDVTGAQKVLKRAIKRHPREASLHAQLGYTWIERENPAEAAKLFQRALKCQPDWQPYLDDLAGALMLCERWEEAAAAAIRSLEHRKKNERAWTVYAIAHSKLGRLDRAEQGYTNAIRAAQNASRAEGNYGLFLAKQPARMLEAVRFLKRARSAHPDWTEIDDALHGLTH